MDGLLTFGAGAAKTTTNTDARMRTTFGICIFFFVLVVGACSNVQISSGGVFDLDGTFGTFLFFFKWGLFLNVSINRLALAPWPHPPIVSPTSDVFYI